MRSIFTFGLLRSGYPAVSSKQSLSALGESAARI